jgi:hypothetical protein
MIVAGVDIMGELRPSMFESKVDALGRPERLPIRNRGTRVWIFCSRILTRARISVTICTPLLFEAGIPVVELVVDADGFRGRTGRGTGVRGGIRDEVDSEGSVLEHAIEDVLDAAGMAGLLGWKPARWRRIDWPDAKPREVDGGRGVAVGTVGGISVVGDRSESWRSGGGVVSRFSSEIVDGGDT